MSAADDFREAKRQNAELADAFARAFEAWVDTASLPPQADGHVVTSQLTGTVTMRLIPGGPNAK